MAMPTKVKDGRKDCPKCNINKPVEEFGTLSSGKVQGYCKECRKACKRGKPVSHKQASSHRARQLKALYGITVEQYETMYEAQGGVCKVCLKPQAGRMRHLCVDHCHATGKVRGLLCNSCNMVLGKVGDSTDILRGLAAYLEETNGIDIAVRQKP